ncbi:response regulator [Rhodoblastus acidophilus]|nr:response regulator [Rhodoblastus acidophilus]RAI22972.1 response regulator [Rhodoblastus acidophilus]
MFNGGKCAMFDAAGLSPPPSILIADDDDDDVYLIRSALKAVGQGAGARVACDRVANGVDALAWLSRRELMCQLPAAVILDINMPRLDGIGVLRALRQSFDMRGLAVFVLTTAATETVHGAALDLGATRIFVKPNTMGELTDIVREILSLVHLGAAVGADGTRGVKA